MTHLVIGASGQVGEHLLKALNKAGKHTTGTYYKHPQSDLHPLDICNLTDVVSIIKELKPAVVYIPASLTYVDYCETHPSESYKTNVLGIRNLVQAVSDTDVRAKIVYFSSDYIFDGRNGPYSENDPANPICEYGRQKLMAEHYVALHARDYLIIRTTVVYGWERQGKNFVYRLIKSVRNGQTIPVPDDQIGSPTYAPDLAQATVELVQANAQGAYHITGADRISRYQFAVAIVDVFGLDKTLIKPISTAELNQDAPRPLNAGMVIDKAEQLLQRSLTGYMMGLQQMKQDRDITTL